ncbi:MAG: 2-C-methyl-D-erythritol 2,4-cyclodiphosphate synthase [Candidatus Eisenbacteria sp.]|nr:2-C-methyl-D-erythritol 2,4-cyclodiphosphate synthase [Candidatus Eisenbacteria bacterium]
MPAERRIGQGWDLHRLVPGRPLVLGGVTIPFDRGLAGHSDADVLVHAAIDALLGALADGDIGAHFPDTDAAWKDAASIDLLRAVAGKVADAGYRIENLDTTVIAEAPRIAPHRELIREKIAEALGLEPARVSVKAKTAEGVGPEGDGSAISAQAIVLLRRG